MSGAAATPRPWIVIECSGHTKTTVVGYRDGLQEVVCECSGRALADERIAFNEAQLELQAERKARRNLTLACERLLLAWDSGSPSPGGTVSAAVSIHEAIGDVRRHVESEGPF